MSTATGYSQETTLGTFTIKNETFTLARVQFASTGNWELHLHSDRETGFRKPTFWYGDRVGDYLPGDTCTEGAYRFYSMGGTALRREKRELQVLVAGDTFTLN